MQYGNAGAMMAESKKMVDTREYVGILEELVRDEKTVGIPIEGNSMSPFLITGRDYVLFRKPERPLKVGDIVFYHRNSGEFVLHRICSKKNGVYFVVGDAQTNIEGPIYEEQIFGVVTRIKRKGKWIDERDFWWNFFATVWLYMRPFRPIVRKLYGAYFSVFVKPHREIEIR